jgi:hypothetical protein
LREISFPPADVHYREIPVIINNFNRLWMLKKLISALEIRGYFNIHIIDNNSTYPPLLEYYKECRYTVYRLNENIGVQAFWKSGICRSFSRNFFVYTDPDVVPVDECPDDFMLLFLDTLKKNRLAQKVGFSLKIDDLPDWNLLKKSIIGCESHFFTDFKKDELLYRAPIGATFALYRPGAGLNHANNHIEIYRTGYPYMARHLPWYQDSRNPDEEEKYYLEHLKHGTWWTTKAKEVFEANS